MDALQSTEAPHATPAAHRAQQKGVCLQNGGCELQPTGHKSGKKAAADRAVTTLLSMPAFPRNSAVQTICVSGHLSRGIQVEQNNVAVMNLEYIDNKQLHTVLAKTEAQSLTCCAIFFRWDRLSGPS